MTFIQFTEKLNDFFLFKIITHHFYISSMFIAILNKFIASQKVKHSTDDDFNDYFIAENDHHE